MLAHFLGPSQELFGSRTAHLSFLDVDYLPKVVTFALFSAYLTVGPLGTWSSPQPESYTLAPEKGWMIRLRLQGSALSDSTS